MQIDWLTVGAQVFNFLVLAWLLKRFLYRPVIEAMAAREARIAERLTQADQREAEAQAETRAYQARRSALEGERVAALADAREAAERERRALLAAAREEAIAGRRRWQQDLAREQADFRAALVVELADAAIEIASRALAELADASLQSQAVLKLARRVRTLPDEDLRRLAAAGPRLQLATTSAPEPAALDTLREALAGALGHEVEIECLPRPGLGFGVELLGGGYKLDWNMAAQLEAVASQVRLGLDEGRQAPADAQRDAPDDAPASGPASPADPATRGGDTPPGAPRPEDPAR